MGTVTMRDIVKDVIVVCTPRAGSQRVHSAFGHAKVASAWEADSKISLSCFLAADIDDYNFRHEPWWNRNVDEVWHQTRHPLYCIAAMADRTPANIWVWQYPVTGLHPREYGEREEFCTRFWIRWNEECEKRNPIWQYRVEDFEEKIWSEMWKRLDLGEAPEINPRSTELDGSAQRVPITWDLVRSYGTDLYDDLRRMAERYGYE
jgi:hypothetical protein